MEPDSESMQVGERESEELGDPELLRDTGRHLAEWAVMIFLTLVAFAATGFHWLSVPALVIVLLVLAAIQVVLQLVRFMHLDPRREGMVTAFIGGGLGLGIIIALSVAYLVYTFHS